jgi:DNA-binding transcriptional LysR family regulator
VGAENYVREALGGQDAQSRIDRFLLIAEHGTIRRAAAELGKSDTTLHKQLTNLEARCSGPLFHRPPRRLGCLAELGEQLRQQADRYLSTSPKAVPS